MEGSTLTITIVAAILGSSVLTAIINGFFNKKSSKADIEVKEAQADSLIGQAYGALLKEINGQYNSLKGRFDELEKDHEACTAINKELMERIELLELKTK